MNCVCKPDEILRISEPCALHASWLSWLRSSLQAMETQIAELRKIPTCRTHERGGLSAGCYECYAQLAGEYREQRTKLREAEQRLELTGFQCCDPDCVDRYIPFVNEADYQQTEHGDPICRDCGQVGTWTGYEDIEDLPKLWEAARDRKLKIVEWMTRAQQAEQALQTFIGWLRDRHGCFCDYRAAREAGFDHTKECKELEKVLTAPSLDAKP